MNEQEDRELEFMERWERRARFWSEVVIGDLVRPTLSALAILVGMGAVVALLAAGVTAWEPYAAALGLATSPAVGLAAGAATEALRPRRPPLE